MISNNPPQCLNCANLFRRPSPKLSCKAFPTGIPEALYTTSVKHDKKYPGDGGILFEKYTGSLTPDGADMSGEDA